MLVPFCRHLSPFPGSTVMDTDRNLLFGVLALQAGLVEATQFIEACLLWTTRKHERIADVLLARGWIDPADLEHLEYLLERRLRKHGGDIRDSLAALPDDLKRSLTALGDADIQRSLVDGTGPAVPHAVATVAYHPGPAVASAASGWPTTVTWDAMWR
jgi:hypothetical protein